MLSLSPVRQNSLVLGALISCILLYTSLRAPSPEADDIFYHDTAISSHRPHRHHHASFAKDKMLQSIYNDTLGFQELFMISLPTRTDKQDTFAMQAALSSIKYTQIDGVDGQMVPPKALPHVSWNLLRGQVYEELANIGSIPDYESECECYRLLESSPERPSENCPREYCDCLDIRRRC